MPKNKPKKTKQVKKSTTDAKASGKKGKGQVKGKEPVKGKGQAKGKKK